MHTTNLLLSALGPEEAEALEPSLIQIAFDRGDVLFDRGDQLQHVWFLESGMVSTLAILRDGSSVEYATVGCEGALGLTSDLSPRRAGARALAQAPGQAHRIERARLRTAVQTLSRLQSLLASYLDQVMAEAQQTAACNALHFMDQRLSKWLLRCHDRVQTDVLPLTQELLSDMLGVQRTSVTGTVRRLEDAGLIRPFRGRIEVLSRSGLEAVACECYDDMRAAAASLGLRWPGRAA